MKSLRTFARLTLVVFIAFFFGCSFQLLAPHNAQIYSGLVSVGSELHLLVTDCQRTPKPPFDIERENKIENDIHSLDLQVNAIPKETPTIGIINSIIVQARLVRKADSLNYPPRFFADVSPGIDSTVAAGLRFENKKLPR